MRWVKHTTSGVEQSLSFDYLSSVEISAVRRAQSELAKGYAPQTKNHRAATLVDVRGTPLGFGVNTDTAQRGKQCAELTAVSRAQIEAKRHNVKTLALGALAVISKRYSTPQAGAAAAPVEPPAAPCGTCLSHIQAQTNILNLSDLKVVMGAGNTFRRAAFEELYPLATVSTLVQVIEKQKVYDGITVQPIQSCCDALGSEFQKYVPQERFNRLLQKVHQELRYSEIAGAPNLKIAYGYFTEQQCLRPRIAPLIETNSPVGHVSGLLTLCSSNELSKSPQGRIKGLLIAVDGVGSEGAPSSAYQFFPGPERQRIFDLADLTQYDIPVFITCGKKTAVVAHISALAPLFEGPTASGSSAKNLPFYTS